MIWNIDNGVSPKVSNTREQLECKVDLPVILAKMIGLVNGASIPK